MRLMTLPLLFILIIFAEEACLGACVPELSSLASASTRQLQPELISIIKELGELSVNIEAASPEMPLRTSLIEAYKRKGEEFKKLIEDINLAPSEVQTLKELFAEQVHRSRQDLEDSALLSLEENFKYRSVFSPAPEIEPWNQPSGWYGPARFLDAQTLIYTKRQFDGPKIIPNIIIRDGKSLLPKITIPLNLDGRDLLNVDPVPFLDKALFIHSKEIPNSGGKRNFSLSLMDLEKEKGVVSLVYNSGFFSYEGLVQVSEARKFITVPNTSEHKIELYDDTLSKTLASCPIDVPNIFPKVFKISPDGRYAALSFLEQTPARKAHLRIWEIGPNFTITSLDVTDMVGFKDSSLSRGEYVRDIIFNPNQKTLYTLSERGRIDLWDLSKGQHLKSILKENPRKEVSEFQLVTGGEILIRYTESAGLAPPVKIGLLKEDRFEGNLELGKEKPQTFSVSPNGYYLALGTIGANGKSHLVIRSLFTGEEILHFDPDKTFMGPQWNEPKITWGPESDAVIFECREGSPSSYAFHRKLR